MIEIISNINMDSLKYYLSIDVLESCGYGNYMLDLSDENSSIYKSESEFVFLFLDINEFNGDFDEFLELVKKFLQKSSKTLILNTVSFYPKQIDTFLYNSLEKELEFNKKILQLKKKYKNVLIFDFYNLSKNGEIYDLKYWYLARIKFNKDFFEKAAKEIEILINTYKYGSKKVLILDMDNTLWGGVIGEEEIKLSNDGIGKIYLDFQKNIKKLKDLGVLLAVCSKNNYEDGIKGFNHPNSILKEEDFIVKKINWQHKAENIKEIARELNLGLDSFVFIDDNPVERESIRQILPEVIVPEFPKEIYKLNDWFLDVVKKHFAKITLTKEDVLKQKQYENNLKRNQLQKNITYEEFLKSLEIKLDFYIDNERFMERYAQMTQKTNQFNLTTKRYTINDIKNFIRNDRYKVIAVNYKDKFGDEGITALVILEEKENEVIIDTFLMSCRILKRDVEKEIMNKILEFYPDKNIIGLYYPTKKNDQVKDLYIKFGFEKIDENTFIRRAYGEKSN
jgi:FkbH-like protein